MARTMAIKKNLPEVIIKNFEAASREYNEHASIQKLFASELAKECAKISIPEGLWVDLGSGTGLLANALEENNPGQKILRVDGSKGMLSQQIDGSKSQLWNLNSGLPNWSEPPSLLASSFSLHWLASPTKRLEEWLKALKPSGWLALVVPIQESFPEWQLACKKANVGFTALPLPSRSLILEPLSKVHLSFHKIHKVTQEADSAVDLLKLITKIGAQGTTKQQLKAGELRRLLNHWPINRNTKKAHLTWYVQMLLVQSLK